MQTKPRWTKWVEQPNGRQAYVLKCLDELGRKRAELAGRKAYMTSTGRREYDRVIDGIRRQINKGVELGLGHEQMREHLGVVSSAYFKIKNGRTAPEA